VTAAVCLQQFYKTKNDTNGSQALWSPATMLFPTIVTLAIAVVIFLFNGIVLCAYCFGKAAVERWTNYQNYVSGFATAVQTTLSIIAAGITLGTSANPNSLYGQTCGAGGDANQLAFPQVNLAGICIMQVHNLINEIINHSNSWNTRCWFRFGWAS
jgi:hypothetical protein